MEAKGNSKISETEFRLEPCSFCVGLKMEDMELSSEEGEDAEAEPKGGEETETETDPWSGFSFGLCLDGEKLGLETDPCSGFSFGLCLDGSRLGLWLFVEEKVRALVLEGGKNLRLRKRFRGGRGEGIRR